VQVYLNVIISETKKPLEIDLKPEPKDDVSDHQSLGAPDYDDAMSLDNYSAQDPNGKTTRLHWLHLQEKLGFTYIKKIPLTLHSRRGSRDNSDIPPRRPRLT
jgi:hypothetical protein